MTNQPKIKQERNCKNCIGCKWFRITQKESSNDCKYFEPKEEKTFKGKTWDEIMNNYRRYDRKRFKDFCNTMTIKGDNLINLPEKPSAELSDVLRIEFNRMVNK